MMHKNNYLNVLLWIVLITLPFLLQVAGVIDGRSLAINQSNGLISILTGTFIHGSFKHMTSNLIGMLLGTSIMYALYKKIYFLSTLLGIIIPSSIMYFLGIPSVGISGLLFTFTWFIIIRGLMSRDKTRFVVGLFMLVFYGMSINTAIPLAGAVKIAWQAHLGGLLTGFMLALYQRLIRN